MLRQFQVMLSPRVGRMWVVVVPHLHVDAPSPLVETYAQAGRSLGVIYPASNEYMASWTQGHLEKQLKVKVMQGHLGIN